MKPKTTILGYENGFPVILAEKEPNGVQWSFYCEYCRRRHYHGKGEGHRGAHCTEDSPFKETGYIITLNPDYFKRDSLKTIKSEAEELFKEEYHKAMAQLRNRNIHPKEKIKIARKIAMAKYRGFLEKHGLSPQDLVEKSDCKLEDLL